MTKPATAPTTAMIMCAGLGTRLKPLTDQTPKALIDVNGRPIIDYILDQLIEAGIKNVVVNLHHHRDQLRAHLSKRKDLNIRLVEEDPILETGGGVVNALPHIHEDVFYVLNGDSFWLEKDSSLFKALAKSWSEDMDFLLSLYPTAKLQSDARTDYFKMNDGKLRYRVEGETAPYIFAGPRLVRRSAFVNQKPEKFSMKVLFDAAEKQGRLYGVATEGEWLNIDTFESLEAARKKLKTV